jgi:hypothetical protein
MSRWALGALSSLILIMGITFLDASPPQGDQDNSQKNHKTKLSKEEKRRQKAILVQMVDPPYWDWLRDEVPHIVTDQERVAFKKLTTDIDRETFIEIFFGSAAIPTRAAPKTSTKRNITGALNRRASRARTGPSIGVQFAISSRRRQP